MIGIEGAPGVRRSRIRHRRPLDDWSNVWLDRSTKRSLVLTILPARIFQTHEFLDPGFFWETIFHGSGERYTRAPRLGHCPWRVGVAPWLDKNDKVRSRQVSRRAEKIGGFAAFRRDGSRRPWPIAIGGLSGVEAMSRGTDWRFRIDAKPRNWRRRQSADLDIAEHIANLSTASRTAGMMQAREASSEDRTELRRRP
jgi:hypothetical protein